MATEPRQTRKKHYDQFDTYIYKVLKQVHPDTGISGSAMAEMDQYVKAVIHMFAERINLLMLNSNKKTVYSMDVESATQLVLPDELARHAVSEGTKAVTKFNSAEVAQEGSSVPMSKTRKAGLVFSVPRVEKLLMQQSVSSRKSRGSSVYLAAVIEYLVAEILELAGSIARDKGIIRITPRHIKLAIHNDEELSRLSKEMVLPGGVVPHIHHVLLPSKKTKKSSS